jgi:hypothetical protein
MLFINIYMQKLLENNGTFRVFNIENPEPYIEYSVKDYDLDKVITFNYENGTKEVVQYKDGSHINSYTYLLTDKNCETKHGPYSICGTIRTDDFLHYCTYLEESGNYKNGVKHGICRKHVTGKGDDQHFVDGKICSEYIAP